jgi:hypothetical protein
MKNKIFEKLKIKKYSKQNFIYKYDIILKKFKIIINSKIK